MFLPLPHPRQFAGQILWAHVPSSFSKFTFVPLQQWSVVRGAHFCWTWLSAGCSAFPQHKVPSDRTSRPPKNPPIFQCRFPAARAPSALFLQEIKYFCVARQTKWRCQRERSRSRSANTKRQRRQKLRHVYKVLQWKSWKIKSSKFTKNPFSTKRCSTGLNRKENEEKQGEKPSTLSYPRSTFITQIK